MNIRIEEINESHFEALISLFQEFATFEKHPDKMINTVERMREDKDLFRGFVAKDDIGNVVGYTVFFFFYQTWTGKSLYMEDLYICESYRGSGLGSKLIHAVIEYAKNTKCRKMRWQVSNWNHSAIGFYEKLGATVNRVDMNCDLEIQEQDSL